MTEDLMIENILFLNISLQKNKQKQLVSPFSCLLFPTMTDGCCKQAELPNWAKFAP